MKNIIILLFIITIMSINSGCLSTNPDEQKIPWGRPADWESASPYYGG